jgi:hypothetical protein
MADIAYEVMSFLHVGQKYVFIGQNNVLVGEKSVLSGPCFVRLTRQ